jgi:hypothetical protein
MVVNEELPIIPLYQYADGYMYDAKKIQGVELNPRLLMQPKWIRRVRVKGRRDLVTNEHE